MLTVNQFYGVLDSAGRVIRVRVSGDVGTCTCETIRVIVSCLDRATGSEIQEQIRDTVPSSSGSWDFEIPAPACAACDSTIKVTAQCLIAEDIINPECGEVSIEDVLLCPTEDCPAVRINTEEISKDCNDDGTRNVRFLVEIIPHDPTATIVTEIVTGDGSTTRARSDRTYSETYRYRPGTYTPSVRVVVPSGCPSFRSAPIAVPECPRRPEPCPDIQRIVSSVDTEGGECADGAERGVTIIWTALTNPTDATGQFEWSFDGGTTFTTPAPDRSKINRYNTPGPKFALVKFTPDAESCPTFQLSGRTEVPACTSPPGIPEIPGLPPPMVEVEENDACFALRLLITILLAAAFLTGIMAACFTTIATELLVAAAAFGAVAIVLMLLYGLATCDTKPCAWFLLILGQALVAAGVGAIIISKCCPWMLEAGSVIASIGAALTLLWAVQCKQTLCRWAIEVVFAIGAFALPAAAAVAAIPVLSSCVDGTAGAIVGGLYGALAAYAVRCKDD